MFKDRVKKFRQDHPVLTTFGGVMIVGFGVSIANAARRNNLAQEHYFLSGAEVNHSLKQINDLEIAYRQDYIRNQKQIEGSLVQQPSKR